MSVAMAQSRMNEIQTELYRAQVALLGLRSVLRDLWNAGQFAAYYEMLSIYRTSIQHIQSAAFTLQRQASVVEQITRTRVTPALPHVFVSYEENESL